MVSLCIYTAVCVVSLQLFNAECIIARVVPWHAGRVGGGGGGGYQDPKSRSIRFMQRQQQWLQYIVGLVMQQWKESEQRKGGKSDVIEFTVTGNCIMTASL